MCRSGAREEHAEYDKIGTYEDLEAFKLADIRAYGLRRWRAHYRLQYPTLYYQRIMRDVEFLEARGHRRLKSVRHAHLKLLSILLGVSIPPGVFGRGLSVPHFGSIVVNDKVRAGRFCRIHSATNIGEAQGRAPRLGDGVYIGPGAVVYGDVRIGSFAVLGANSVVNRDVQDSEVAVGAPARVISAKGSFDVMPSWVADELFNVRSSMAAEKPCDTASD